MPHYKCRECETILKLESQPSICPHCRAENSLQIAESWQVEHVEAAETSENREIQDQLRPCSVCGKIVPYTQGVRAAPLDGDFVVGQKFFCVNCYNRKNKT